MALDGASHLSDLAAEAKAFDFKNCLESFPP
jgi:hypothetical protein